MRSMNVISLRRADSMGTIILINMMVFCIYADQTAVMEGGRE